MRSLALRLAFVRLRKDITFAATMMTAIALALLSLFALQGVSNSRASSLVDYSMNSLPTGDRTLTVSSSRVIPSDKDYRAISAFLNKNASGVLSAKFLPQVLFHETSDSHGVGFYLGGIDNVQAQFHLTSGRFPRVCNSSRCEVLQIGDTNLAPQPASYGLVIVGAGQLTNKNLFSGTFALEPGVPLLLSDGISSLHALKKISSLQGSNGWVGDLDRKKISDLGVDSLINTIISLENKAALDFPNLSFTWPEDTLAEASDAGAILRAKVNTINHEVITLLTVFLVLLCLRKKSNHQQFRASLSRIGTPKSILIQEATFEYAIPIVLGAIFAALLSPILLLTLNAMGFETDSSQLFLQWMTYPFLLLSWFCLQLGITFQGDRSWGWRTWIPFGFAIIFVALFIRLSPNNSIDDWKPPVFGAVFSVLLSFIATNWISHYWQRHDRSTFIILREDFVMWQGIAAILSFTIFLAALSLSFHSSVNRNIDIQVRDRVPFDIVVKPSPTLIKPLDLGSVSIFESLLKGSRAFPVLRSGSSIRGKGSVSDSLSILGIPYNALAYMSAGNDGQKSEIAPTALNPEPGIALGDSEKLHVQLSNIPKQVDVIAWFRTPFGEHASVIFNGHSLARSLQLRGNIPPGSVLVALELRETSDYVSRRLHAQGEGNFQVPVIAGTGGIVELKKDDIQISLIDQGWNVSSFKYSFDGDSLYLRPVWKSTLPSVIVDPQTSALAENEILTLSGPRNSSFQVRVVATRSAFPSAGDRFVIINLEDLQSIVAPGDPGAIDPIEIWISTPNSKLYETLFKKSNLQSLSLESQRTLGNYLRRNPSNTGLESGYRVALGFAAILTLILLISALPLVRRGKRVLLFHLETQGDGPEGLRASLRKSLLTAVLASVCVGTVAGLIGSELFVAKSPPLAAILLVAASVVALSEIGSRLYLRTCFNEKSMVGVKYAN